MQQNEIKFRGDLWAETLRKLKSELIDTNDRRHNLHDKNEKTIEELETQVRLDLDAEDLTNRIREVEKNLSMYQAAYDVTYSYSQMDDGIEKQVAETRTIFSTTNLNIDNPYQLNVGTPEAISLSRDIAEALEVYKPYRIIGVTTQRLSEYLKE